MKFPLTLLALFVAFLSYSQTASYTTITSNNPVSGDLFGHNIATTENYLAVTSEGDFSIFIYEKNPTQGTWDFHQKINVPESGDGHTINKPYSVDISDDYIIIGDRGGYDTIPGNSFVSMTGEAFIFKKQNGSWVYQQKIISPQRISSEHFGNDVSIYGDYIAIGAPGGTDIVNGQPVASAVYIYKKDANDQWQFYQKIQAQDHKLHNDFGYELEIHGTTLVTVGAKGVYIFELNNSSQWTQVQKLVSNSSPSTIDGFGLELAINKNLIAVASPLDSYDEQGQNYIENSGSVYVYKKTSGQWSLDKKLVSDTRKADANFGTDVKFHGGTLLVNSRRGAQSSNVPFSHREIKDILRMYNTTSYNIIWQDSSTFNSDKYWYDDPIAINSSGVFLGLRGFDTGGKKEAGVVLFYSNQNNIGLNSTRQLFDIDLYPNPASEVIYFNFPQEHQSKENEICIIDVSGNLVKRLSLQANTPEKFSISLKELKNGFYTIQYISEKYFSQEKFLKVSE